MFLFLLLTQCLSDPGTTLTLEQIVKGRCYTKAGTDSYLKTLNWDCEGVYDNLTNAYAGKDPLSITSVDFQPFLKATFHQIPVNKSMFWTGSSSVSYNPDPNTIPNRDIVHEYSYFGFRYWTLEDSMWGGLMNGLNFCGAGLDWFEANTSVFNYSTCQPYGSPGSSYYFWTAASTQFAQQARGDVFMLGYAGTRRIYRNGTDPNYPNETASIFASVEIKNLNASQITSFTALIIPSTAFPTEVCGQGSVAQMQYDLTAIAGIPPENVFCIDNPDAVRHQICVDDWFTPQCAFFDEVAGSSSSGLSTPQVWAIGIVVGFVGGILMVGIAIKISQKKRTGEDFLLVAPETA
jgi:hypothetical protein